jgi:hypothetical protein
MPAVLSGSDTDNPRPTTSSGTQRTRSQLRRPPLRSSEFVQSACWDSMAGPSDGQDHSAYIPDHGRSRPPSFRLAAGVAVTGAVKRGRGNGCPAVTRVCAWCGNPLLGPVRGVMRCAGRSAAARPGTRSCAQPSLIDNPKLLLICPCIHLVLPLCPDVSRSNVLLRLSVILHVDWRTWARGLARAGWEFACGSNVAARGRFVRVWRAWGGIILWARHARRVARPWRALVKIVRCHRSRMPRAPHRAAGQARRVPLTVLPQATS